MIFPHLGMTIRVLSNNRPRSKVKGEDIDIEDTLETIQLDRSSRPIKSRSYSVRIVENEKTDRRLVVTALRATNLKSMSAVSRCIFLLSSHRSLVSLHFTIERIIFSLQQIKLRMLHRTRNRILEV